jgi:carboxyl-terminal processing protease
MKKLTGNIFFLSVIFLLSCVGPNEDEFTEVNSWIRENMEENYLWNERVPENVDGSIVPNSYFGSMLDPDDFDSYIVDDVKLLPSEVTSDATVFTTGLSPVFGRFSNSFDAFIVAEFIYPNTPADTSGLNRGDIIIEIDGAPLTVFNVVELFYAEKSTTTYTFGRYNAADQTIISTDDTISLPQVEIELNPIVHTDVIEENGTKIGYMFYNEFVDGENDKYIDSVDVVFQDMIAQGVTEMIVDLRYNNGGSFDAAKNIGNSLVSQSAAQNEEVFVRFKYNALQEQRIIDEEGEDSESLRIKFDSDPDNLGLQSVYFLTSSETSNTSELLINGLIPHMSVNIIGGQTSGQFYGSTVIKGEDATPQNNYAMVPVNLRYENSEGNSDLFMGLEPDVFVSENLLDPFQIGDLNEPFLKAALERISGGSQSVQGQADQKQPFEKIRDIRAERKGSILFRSAEKN